MWAQYDFGDGPRVGGQASILFCFWLAWCRSRVLLPLADKSPPSVFAAIDTALRRIGGVPRCWPRSGPGADDLRIDSLTLTEVVVAAEDRFGVLIPDDEWPSFGRASGRWKTLFGASSGCLLRLCEQQLAGISLVRNACR